MVDGLNSSRRPRTLLTLWRATEALTPRRGIVR